MQIEIAKLESIGTWELPYIDIIPLNIEQITGFTQSDWNVSWTIDHEETLEDITIEQIQLISSATYFEKTQDRDTPRFTMTLFNLDSEWLDSIAFASRDIYSGTEIANPDLVLDVPLREFAEDFENFKSDNPSESKFTKTYKIKLQVNLKREKWYNPAQTSPTLTKYGEVTLNITIPTSTSIVTEGHPGIFSTIQLRGIKTGNIKAIGSDLNSLQYSYFTQNTSMEWNTYYHIAWDVLLSNLDLPATLTCDVKESDNGGQKIVKEFSFSKKFLGDVTSEPIRKLQAYREKGFWKWWDRIIFFEPPIGLGWAAPLGLVPFDNTVLKPVGPYEKTFYWNIIIVSDKWPEERYPPRKMAITIRVPQWKIDQMWAAYWWKIGGYAIGQSGFIIGSIICAGALAGNSYVTGSSVHWWLPSGLGALAIGLIIIIVSIIAGIAIEAISEFVSIHASTECSIEYDVHYAELYEFEDPLEKAHEALKELPDFMRNFFVSASKITELAKAIKIGFSRFLSALKDEDIEASQLQSKACMEWFSSLEDEVLQIYENKILSLSYISKPPIPYDDALSEIFNDTTFDEENMNELETNPLLKELLISYKNIERTEEIFNEQKYNEFFEKFPETMKKLYDGVVNSHLESLKKIKEIKEISKLRGSHLLISLFNYGLISKEELEERIKKIGFNHQLLALQTFQFTKVTLKLHNLGIFTTFDLLERCRTPTDRKNIVKQLKEPDQEPYDVLLWANLADLMRIEGVGEMLAKDLEEVGVDTVMELSQRNDKNLTKILKELWVNRKDIRLPYEKNIARWISDAKLLGRMIEY